jgi:hypothetical protein
MQITTIYTAASRPGTGEVKPFGGGFINRIIAIYRNFTYIGRNGTFVSRTFARFTRFIKDYRYYRGKGFNSKSAWYLASMTLP